ncbi:exosome complex exonuclease RRP46-like protein [Senna tora]|uniref:Exosome complex exonuclease RRP46-like protein n=1 Tax=Senna tora TaxID=362788 RepID=A0A834TXV9_9FABA|nr:exosome complex exonuclease RRP46-like protein [Senna tora]
MEIDRPDGRSPSQLRPLACSRGVLNRAHGSASWTQGETKVLAAVYGPKAGTRKNENPEKASIEVIWKPKTGHIGKLEKESEMTLKKTLESICIRSIYPNTTTSIIIQSFSLFPSHIFFSPFLSFTVPTSVTFLMLVSAVAICCCVADSGYVLLDPNKLEEEKMKAFAYLVFPNTIVSILPEGSLQVGSEPMEHGIITSVTQGAMSVDDYLLCLERGRAASARMSEFLRKSLQPQLSSDSSKAG